MRSSSNGRGTRGAYLLAGALAIASLPACRAAENASSASASVTPKTTAEPFTFTTTLGKGHPLVGLFYDPATRAMVTRDDALDRVRSTTFLFLGEKHDNPDHHRFEAVLIRVSAQGRPAAVVMEMMPRDKQPAIDALFALPGTTVTSPGIAAAVEWSKSGWPAFSEYQPVFDAVLSTRARLYAGDLPSASAHAIAHKGAEALDPTLVTNFHLSTPIATDQEAAFEKEIADVHCGMLPAELVPRMVLAQRARDATLAETVIDAKKAAEVVILVSGNGHARTDRAVPKLVRDQAGNGNATAKMLSVGMIEVDDEKKALADYAAEFSAAALPFDLVWFTPRANDDDPCAKMTTPSK